MNRVFNTVIFVFMAVCVFNIPSICSGVSETEVSGEIVKLDPSITLEKLQQRLKAASGAGVVNTYVLSADLTIDQRLNLYNQNLRGAVVSDFKPFSHVQQVAGFTKFTEKEGEYCQVNVGQNSKYKRLVKITITKQLKGPVFKMETCRQVSHLTFEAPRDQIIFYCGKPEKKEKIKEVCFEKDKAEYGVDLYWSVPDGKKPDNGIVNCELELTRWGYRNPLIVNHSEPAQQSESSCCLALLMCCLNSLYYCSLESSEPLNNEAIKTLRMAKYQEHQAEEALAKVHKGKAPPETDGCIIGLLASIAPESGDDESTGGGYKRVGYFGGDTDHSGDDDDDEG